MNLFSSVMQGFYMYQYLSFTYFYVDFLIYMNVVILWTQISCSDELKQ